MFAKFARFLREEDGPTASEYALMLGFLIAVCIVAIGALGNTNSSMWNSSANQINSALGS